MAVVLLFQRSNSVKKGNSNSSFLYDLLWSDRDEVKKEAEKYDKTPWYQSNRFSALCLTFIYFIVSALSILWPINSYGFVGLCFLGGALLYCTWICYFIMKGYRFIFVVMILYIGIEIFNRFIALIDSPANKHAFVLFFFLGCAFIKCYITCFRIENLRVRKKNNKKLSLINKINVVLFITVTAFFVGSAIYEVQSSDYKINKSLNKKYGYTLSRQAQIIHLYTQVIPEICMPTWVNTTKYVTDSISPELGALNIKYNFIDRFIRINDNIIQNIPEDLHEQIAKEKFSNYIQQKFLNIIYASSGIHDKNVDKQINLEVDKMTFCMGVVLETDEYYKIENIIKELTWF